MTKTEIAKTIVDICQNDASFCKDLKGGDPGIFLSRITDGMSDKDFLFSVERYLATFKVWGHLYFYQKQRRIDLGFHVRRYRNSLFVTHAEQGLPFSKGDEIIAVDGSPIECVADKFPEFFDGDPPDRQGERWETVISNANRVTVRAQRTFGYAVRTDVERGQGEPSCTFRPLSSECYYVKFTNFFDEQDVQAVTEHASEEILRTKNLIIDLRNNCGGNDVEFLPLLKFLLTENDPMCGKPVFCGEEEILYTERNAEGRIKAYREYLESVTSDEIRNYLLGEIGQQTKNKGKGFLPAKADGFLFPDRGVANPEKVVILIDYGCASSAESLVEIAARLKKVTLIGRPTMGICDYSNLTRYDFGEYVLHYPTSRSKAIDAGMGTRGHGLQPHISVPWTPQHLRTDVDLMTALHWLKT